MNAIDQILQNRLEAIEVTLEAVKQSLISLRPIGTIGLKVSEDGSTFCASFVCAETKEMFMVLDIALHDVLNYINCAFTDIDGINEDNLLCYALLETVRDNYDSIVYEVA